MTFMACAITLYNTGKLIHITQQLATHGNIMADELTVERFYVDSVVRGCYIYKKFRDCLASYTRAIYTLATY